MRLPQPVKQLLTITMLASLSLGTSLAQGVTEQGLTDAYQHPYSAQTMYSHSHSSVMNDDFSPTFIPDKAVEIWRSQERVGLIPGVLNPFNPVQHPDGKRIFNSSSRGPGFSHFHAMDMETGAVVWETPPWMGEDDHSTPGPSIGTHTIDVNGNLYFIDDDDMFSYDANGKLRWSRTFTDGRGPWVGSPIFSNGGNLLAIHQFTGLVGVYDRETGNTLLEWESDFMDIQPQPCNVPDILAVIGSTISGIYRPIMKNLLCAAVGSGLKITETQALDPRRNRLLYMGSAPDGEGRAYAAQITEDENGVSMDWVWQSWMPAGTGTSPTVNINLDLVIGAGGDGIVYAFNLEDGSLAWKTQSPVEVFYSPPVSQDGYLLSSNQHDVIAFSSEDGSELWRESYDHLLPLTGLEDGPVIELPVVGLITDGQLSYLQVSGLGPSAGSPGFITMNPVFGYKMNLPFSVPLPIMAPIKQGSVFLRDNNGTDVENSLLLYEGRGTTLDVGLGFTPQGFGNAQFTELLSGMYSGTLNLIVGVIEPFYLIRPLARGGIVGVEPADFKAFAQKQLRESRAYGEEARDHINANGDLQRAFNVIRWTRHTLEVGVPDVLDTLRERKLISQNTRNQVANQVSTAESEFAKAKIALLGDPAQNDLDRALQALLNADAALQTAQDLLAAGKPGKPGKPGKKPGKDHSDGEDEHDDEHHKS